MQVEPVPQQRSERPPHSGPARARCAARHRSEVVFQIPLYDARLGLANVERQVRRTAGPGVLEAQLSVRLLVAEDRVETRSR